MKNFLEKALISTKNDFPNVDLPRRCGKTTFLRKLIVDTKSLEPNKHITMITPTQRLATTCYHDLYSGRIINTLISEYMLPEKIIGMKTDYIFSDEVENCTLYKLYKEDWDFHKKYKCGFYTSYHMEYHSALHGYCVLRTGEIV